MEIGRICFSCLKMLLIIILFISCLKKDSKRYNEYVTDIIGKEMHFPEDISCRYLGRDTIYSGIDTPYKILLYNDSIGCTSCKLQLYKWTDLINEVNSEMKNLVSFCFYFQPKDEKELRVLMRRDNFKQVVYIDKEGELGKINKISTETDFQCFLLDKDNKVVLVGNPTKSYKIWKLYKKVIMGEI